MQEIEYTKQDGIATIRLNRPHAGNALTRQMRPRISAIWADIRDDPEVAVAVITGAGQRHFCTGADLKEVAQTGTTPSGKSPIASGDNAIASGDNAIASGDDDVAGEGAGAYGSGTVAGDIVWSPLQNEVWKPVICAVNGLVAGGGLHFVADADIVLAADHAEFMDTHVSVGQVGAVENIGLTRRLPLGTVLRMTLMGSRFRLSAQRAYQLGLVDELVPLTDLASTAAAMAKAIAENSPAAMALSKRAIWSAAELPHQAALEYGWALARGHRTHPDFLEGSRAFTERRRPQWTRSGPARSPGEVTG